MNSRGHIDEAVRQLLSHDQTWQMQHSYKTLLRTPCLWESAIKCQLEDTPHCAGDGPV